MFPSTLQSCLQNQLIPCSILDFSLSATNQSNLTATTITDLVSQINTLLLPKFNEIVTLVVKLRLKLTKV